MRVVILTADSLRHVCFRKALSIDQEINVVKTFCESKERSFNSNFSSMLQKRHIDARTRSERDFFEPFVKMTPDYSNHKNIGDGDINNEEIIEEIYNLKPDLIIAYGCSIVRGQLLERFQHKIINIHLGLSPYYRGSGTNFFPFVNGELEYVGVTFMFMDSGIDTGEIIHQIRADFFEGDTIHSINNRLIWKMIYETIHIIKVFQKNLSLCSEKIDCHSAGRLYRKADFTDNSILKVIDNFNRGIVEKYLQRPKEIQIIENPLLIGVRK